MKHTFLSIALLFCGLMAVAQGIKFEEGSWEQVLKKAKEQNKLIFVDGTTVWCKPCKWMEQNVFTTKEAGDFYNEKFLVVKMDLEKGEGIEFKKRHNIYAYPTLLFVDGDEIVHHRDSGAKGVEALIALGERALDPQSNLIGMNKKYDAGERSQEFIREYIPVLGKAYNKKKQKEIFEWYYANTSEEQMFNEEDFTVIMSVVDTDAPAFEFVLKNYKKFKEIVGEDVYDTRVYGKLIVPFSRLVYGDKEEEMLQESVRLKPLYPEGVQRAEDMAMIRSYKTREMTPELYKACVAYIEKHAMESPGEIIYCMDLVIKGPVVQDKSIYENALEVLRAAHMNMPGEFKVGDVYAALLYKSGDKSLAKQEAEKVLDKAPREVHASLWSTKILQDEDPIFN